MARPFPLLVFLALGGCTAQVGMHPSIELPPDTAAICEQQCADIGMALDAVAIVGVGVACVCEKPGASAKTNRAARVAAAVELVRAHDDEEVSPTSH